MVVLRPSGRAPTVHACRAVVAVRLGWPGCEEAFLRALTVLIAAGEPPHYSDTFELAAARAGLPVAELAAFAGRPEVQETLEQDAAMARGRPCPFFDVDGAALARLERRPAPSSAAEVLEWAPYPLTAPEVAAICGRDVRAELERVARLEPAGPDGFWRLPGDDRAPGTTRRGSSPR
jgi:hypothetical protein